MGAPHRSPIKRAHRQSPQELNVIKQAKKGFTLIELMIVVAIIGILAAIAIPNFIKFQARSKQSEVKANLKAVYTAQKAYMQEKDKYSGRVADIGFAPERGNRYAYYVGGIDTCTKLTAAAPTATSGDNCIEVDVFRHEGAAEKPVAAFTANVTTQIPYLFNATAAGNIDNDSMLDQWSISSESRPSGTSGGATDVNTGGGCPDGANPAGAPCNDQNDV